MKLLIATELRGARGPEGQIYADGPAKYAFWSNYLEVFAQVTILARVAAETREYPEEARADGPSVTFFPLPDYRGPWQYLRHVPELRRRARQAIDECDAYILRVPGLVGGLVWRELRKRKKPYALEVVGDPWDALGPGTWPGLFRPAFREILTRELKRMSLEASAVHYVTQKWLQRRYPATQTAYSVGFSDALMDSAFVPRSKMEERFRRIATMGTHVGTSRNGSPSNAGRAPLLIGFVGGLSHMYKGLDVMLRALAICRSRGLNAEARLAGEGRFATPMKELARKLGIAEHVQFLGQIPGGEPVFAFLDSVDLFVMPSRAEGLPRAMLEAMARGCPCIGSDAGGIPELLDSSDMVPVGEPKALADKIAEVAENPARLEQMATRNLEKAKQFSPELLRDLRREFHRYLRDCQRRP